eukprot:4709945-Pleurochrysis_carterae.AAC.1
MASTSEEIHANRASASDWMATKAQKKPLRSSLSRAKLPSAGGTSVTPTAIGVYSVPCAV